MKRLLTTLLLVCAVMTAADVAAQPLLRTHVETGDVEGIADGTLAGLTEGLSPCEPRYTQKHLQKIRLLKIREIRSI